MIFDIDKASRYIFTLSLAWPTMSSLTAHGISEIQAHSIHTRASIISLAMLPFGKLRNTTLRLFMSG